MVDEFSEGSLRAARVRAIQYTLAALVLASLAIGFALLPDGEYLAFASGLGSLSVLAGSFLTVRRAKLESGDG
ncbi:hypothetical protein BRD03_05700 [Halobacteriales archaeon QS_9_68_17]|nr:MAG: hypothetical protein BRD03_05700 [Halobacteriales archaeon QS_9_68_17]